jgi:hypothetical protein
MEVFMFKKQNDDNEGRWLRVFSALGEPTGDEELWILEKLEEYSKDKRWRSAGVGDSQVSGLKSIILTSADPERLANFYSNTVGLKFKKEQHHGVSPHWACSLAGIHLAIHQMIAFNSNTKTDNPTDDLTRITFSIENMDDFLGELAEKGVNSTGPTFNVGSMKFTGIQDPDGRQVYFGTPWKR